MIEIGNLRDLTVGIDFEDKATTSIKKVNKELDKSKTSFAAFGQKVDENERKMTAFGKVTSTIGGKISNVFGRAKQDLSKYGEEIDNITNKMGNAAKFAGGTIAAGFAGFATVAGKEYIEMDKAFSHLEARTNATGKELEALKNTSKTLYSEGFGENIPQISNDLSILAGQFKNLSEEQLTKMGKGIYTVTELWGQDFNEVSRTVSVLQKNFDGLSETDALDAITYGFQNGMDFSGEFLDTLREYAPQFKEMGMDVGNMMSVLQAGTDAGAWNLDKVGDAIKESHLRMGALDKATVEAYKSLGFNAEEYVGKIAKGGEVGNKAFQEVVRGLMKVEDATLRNQLATDLFGTQYEDLQEKVIFAMADATNATIDFGGATEKASKKMHDNFGAKMTKTWNTLKIKMAEAFDDAGGQELLDSIAKGAERLVPKISEAVTKTVEFGNSVRDNWGTIKPTLTIAGTAVAGFVLVLGALRVINTINNLMNLYKSGLILTTIAQRGLNIAMLASPLGMIVVGMTAVIAAGILLWQNWDTMKEKAMLLWDKVKEVSSGIKLAFSDAWNSVAGFAGNAVNKMIDGVNKFIGVINKIPGVDLGEVKNVNWGKSDGVDGSHATGLSYVPFDGYKAELHKGESVLTANQSAFLKRTGIISDDGAGKPVIRSAFQDTVLGNGMIQKESTPVIEAKGNILRKNVIQKESDQVIETNNHKQESIDGNYVININVYGNNNPTSTTAKMVRDELANFFKRKKEASF